MNNIPRAKEILSAIMEQTSLIQDDQNIQDSVRDYLVSLNEYRTALERGDTKTAERLFGPINEFNMTNGLENNPLVKETLAAKAKTKKGRQ